MQLIIKNIYKTQMDVDEELDLRLIKKQSSKSILAFKSSKFDEDYIIIKTLAEGENGNIYFIHMSFLNAIIILSFIY